MIYNINASWPSSANATAQARLTDFFARGGGYIAGNASTNNFSFLAAAGLVSGSLTGQPVGLRRHCHLAQRGW